MSLSRAGGVEQNKLIGIRNWEPAQDNLLKNRKDTGVGADAEGQSQDGNRGECRVFGQHSETEPNIAPQAVHHFSFREPSVAVMTSLGPKSFSEIHKL